jgi:uncharacterized protein
MTKRHYLKRREFIQCSTAAVVAGLGVPLKSRAAANDSIEEAASKVGMLPHRKLGYSGRKVSVIIGAGNLDPAVAEAGIKCGMNYWHLSNFWEKTGVPATILKNREEHYCQVTIDRAGGNHETGRIDEETHYLFVKDALQKTKLRYFDDMQFHFGYHNVAELKKERGFIRAFERLKKEGLVKHLCLSQHGYAGNSKVPGGEGAAEILTAVVEDAIYESAQFMYSYGEDPAINQFIEFARKKHFGTIAMKTSRAIGRMKEDANFMKSFPAGTAPHNALARWVTTATKIDLAIIRVRNLAEFTETYSGAGRPLRAADARAIELMTAQADKIACRLCTECQPHCPQHVPVAEILRFERYALDDRDIKTARELYAGLDQRANDCIACGTCMKHCPQKLIIPQKLKEAHILLNRA